MIELLLIVFMILTIKNFFDIKKLNKKISQLSNTNYQKDVNKEIYKPPKYNFAKSMRRNNQKKDFEGLFGKNIIAIIASILIFIGTIAFGALIFAYINDFGKAIIILLFGLAMFFVGLYAKNKINKIPLILMGCGIGVIYINIFISSIAFELFSPIIMFLFILVWMFTVFIISKKENSAVLWIMSNLGGSIATFFAFAYGYVNNFLVEIIIFQIITNLFPIFTSNKNLIIFRNILIEINFIINIFITGNVLYINNTIISNSRLFDDEVILNSLLIIAVFGISCFIYNNLLNNYCNKIHVFISSILQCVLSVISFTFPVYTIYFTLTNMENYYMLISILIIGMLFSQLPQSTNYYNQRDTVFISNIIHGVIILVSMIYFFSDFNSSLPMFFILAGAIFVFSMMTRDERYKLLVQGIMIFEFIFSIGISRINFIEVEFIYIFFILGIYIGISRYYNSVFETSLPYLIWNNLVLFPLIINNFELSKIAALNIIMIINIILVIIDMKLSARNKIIDVINGIAYNCINFTVIISMIFAKPSFELVVLSILLTIFILLPIRKLFNNKHIIYPFWYALRFTYVSILLTDKFTPIFDYVFAANMACMIIAMIFIFFGFYAKCKYVRIYGLCFLMINILKIVTIDMLGQDSTIRVISLILGGIICFVISAIYNKFSEKLDVNSADLENNNKKEEK